MNTELNLRFPDKDHVIVSFYGEESGALPFQSPITTKDREDLRWYLEVYGAHSLGDPDDEEAGRIAKQLPVLGKALFNAVFRDRAAQRLFNHFQDSGRDARLLTISSEHSAILALPWELLHDSNTGGVFLFSENPRISIRRRVAGATGGRSAVKVKSKDRLHLLFVISRPEEAGFLDPRADASAVIDAVETHAPGRFTWEVLLPPTLDALVERLQDRSHPPVDILHFDGHGVFDSDGGLPGGGAVEERKVVLQQILSGHIFKDRKADAPVGSPPNTGYLLFEKPDGQPAFVSAGQLGQNLHRHNVALIILSACESAAHGESEEPLNSVAARLTAGGIPAVLAMTHSVLIHTTRALFGEFYKHLAKGHGIGESLDNARRYLCNQPQKYEVPRYDEQHRAYRKWLELHDWFVPALYQAGTDAPLLRKSEVSAPKLEASATQTNIPGRPETGFLGRKQELWDIERWFADRTRRITITGFGGQGKTALAQEAARWLTRIGLFKAAVFVDYSRMQALDAVAVAVSNIGSVLGESLIDAQSAGQALRQTAALVVLDNLEALAPEPLRELLDAAKLWSENGRSRLLLTTRTPDFGDSEYRAEGTHIHRRIVLNGLGRKETPDDALEWLAQLLGLPPKLEISTPKREAVIELFDKVRFRPLSILVVTQQLKTRGPAELSKRLDELLAGRAGASATGPSEALPPELVASLNLSLDRLDDAARKVLPRLGVFQGGAFEDDLLAITGLGDNVWPNLRRQLEAAALIQAETVQGVMPPFMRFHPTLAPMLWEQLGVEERAQLTTAHRQRYYALADYLYDQDLKNPHQARAIALRELPNLLRAVHAAFVAQDPDAVDFADSVTKFLSNFGLKREADSLTAQAQASAGPEGSRAWCLAQSNRGEQLQAEGRVEEAAKIFETILARLGDDPSFERATTLGRLGRCFGAGGRLDLAESKDREGIAVTEKLEQSDFVKRLTSALHGDLADVLLLSGRYAEARREYEAGLRICEELDYLRGQGVILGQLGTLAMQEGNQDEALTRYRAALALFSQLREPAMEAVFWHQLGLLFRQASQWDEAERHHRESARIEEELGNLAGAATTWNQLAIVNEHSGKPSAAEMWYRKAIENARILDQRLSLSGGLNNLANLLRTQPGRFAEARQLAEESLAIKQTLDAAAATIWTTYHILAEIADEEAALISDSRRKSELQTQARDYRRLAREAKRDFPGTRIELQKHAPLILVAVLATQQPAQRKELEKLFPGLEEGGWIKLVSAIRRILAGERNPETLCDALDLEDSAIIETILAALSDPSTLEDLLPPEGSE